MRMAKRKMHGMEATLMAIMEFDECVRGALLCYVCVYDFISNQTRNTTFKQIKNQIRCVSN